MFKLKFCDFFAVQLVLLLVGYKLWPPNGSRATVCSTFFGQILWKLDKYDE